MPSPKEFASPEDAYWQFFRADSAKDAEGRAAVMSYPHVRVSAQGRSVYFETPESYASSASREEREATGWVRSRGVEPVRLHESADKVHLAGDWTRYNINDDPILSNRVNCILTPLDGSWGIQARFGVDSFDDSEDNAIAAAAAVNVVERFHTALGGGDFYACARLCRYPLTEVGIGEVRRFEDAAAARRRFAAMTNTDKVTETRAVQTGSHGVVGGVTANGASGQASRAVFLVGNHGGQWHIVGISAIAVP